MKKFLTPRAQSDWAFPIVLSAITFPVLICGLLGLTYAFVWSPPPQPSLPPSFHRWRNPEIIAAFHDAGLTADVIRGATKDERDGFSTWMHVEATPFRLTARPEERGMILSFSDASDLKRMQAYYLGLNKSLPQYHSWLFARDNVLLQINGAVSEAKAKEYAAVLDALGGW